MKLEDFGINPMTMVHNPVLTEAESRFMGILWVDHFGADNKIPANDLAVLYEHALCGGQIDRADLLGFIRQLKRSEEGRNTLESWKRNVRKMSSHLLMRHENLPVLSKAGIGGGYWVAANDEEIEEFFNSFRKRGIHGIVKASRANKSRLAGIVQQLAFEFEDLVDPASPSASGVAKAMPDKMAGKSPDGGQATAYVVVDALIEKMMRNPEKFGAELQRLGEKLGSVLLPKQQYEEMKTYTQRLQELVASMGG
jgi:hypothetical protein